jgi:hypothetical protein
MKKKKKKKFASRIRPISTFSQEFIMKFWQFNMSHFVEVVPIHLKFEARNSKSETNPKFKFSKFKTKTV